MRNCIGDQVGEGTWQLSGGGEEGLRMGTAFSYSMGLLTAEETNNINLVGFLKIILKLFSGILEWQRCYKTKWGLGVGGTTPGVYGLIISQIISSHIVPAICRACDRIVY